MACDLCKAAIALALFAPILLGLASCGRKTEVETTVKGTGTDTTAMTPTPTEGDTIHEGGTAANRRPVTPAVEPERVVVQHILIGFKKDDGTTSVPDKPITRSRDEASNLAQEILNRAWNGEDFDSMVRQYTDDAHPGIYKLANRGVTPSGGDESRREAMVAGFGNVAFSLSPGNVSVAAFDTDTSPFGWHVIMRIQ